MDLGGTQMTQIAVPEGLEPIFVVQTSLTNHARHLAPTNSIEEESYTLDQIVGTFGKRIVQDLINGWMGHPSLARTKTYQPETEGKHVLLILSFRKGDAFNQCWRKIGRGQNQWLKPKGDIRYVFVTVNPFQRIGAPLATHLRHTE